MDDCVALNKCYLCRKRNIRDKANVIILNFSSLDLDLLDVVEMILCPFLTKYKIFQT